MEDTIFGKITRGDIPTEFLYEDDQCVVIRDIHPQAPTHVLIIPRKPIPRLVDSSADDQALLGHLLLVPALRRRRVVLLRISVSAMRFDS